MSRRATVNDHSLLEASSKTGAPPVLAHVNGAWFAARHATAKTLVCGNDGGEGGWAQGMIERSLQMETGTQEHVFFVDDEPKVRRVVRKMLERAGIHVSCFGTADECLSHLTSERCDLLITDVKMPGRDGIELLIAVKELQPWLPVIVVTGFGNVPMAVRALKAGAADFLEKPLDREVLLKTIRTIARRSTAQGTLLDHSLTKVEMKVLFHILEGKNNREVADLLHRSPRTVEVHRRHVMRKLNADNVVELVRRAAELRLFDLVEAPTDNSH